MNWKQKLVLWLGIIVFVAMALFPPVFTQQQYETSGGSPSYRQITLYTWLFEISGQKMNYDRLLLQWAILFAILTGGLNTFKDPSPLKKIHS